MKVVKTAQQIVTKDFRIEKLIQELDAIVRQADSKPCDEIAGEKCGHGPQIDPRESFSTFGGRSEALSWHGRGIRV